MPRAQGSDALKVMEAFHKAGETPLLVLDRLDEKLLELDRWLFAGYDELDTLADYDWQTMGTAISDWLLDHIRDGQDKAYPRALVRLIEQTALNEIESQKAGYSRLIDPTSLRRAIENVSELQVTQAISNEWPWLFGVRQRIKGESVPITRRKLEYLLSKEWDSSWNPNISIRPPTEDQRGLVSYLVEIGIMRQRGDGRLDAPDLYQSDSKLKRIGGGAETNRLSILANLRNVQFIPFSARGAVESH